MDKLKCEVCGDDFDGDTTETLCDDCAFAEDSDAQFEEEGEE